MRRKEKTIQVWSVLYDAASSIGPYGGGAGDGTAVAHFSTEREAIAFASKNSVYGRRAKVTDDMVPMNVARRWGVV